MLTVRRRKSSVEDGTRVKRPPRGTWRGFQSIGAGRPKYLLRMTLIEFLASIKMPELDQIKVSDISPDPENPRERFPQEELTRLAESIEQVGILVPVVVYRFERGYRLL